VVGTKALTDVPVVLRAVSGPAVGPSGFVAVTVTGAGASIETDLSAPMFLAMRLRGTTIH
jgi:hypothetical protein